MSSALVSAAVRTGILARLRTNPRAALPTPTLSSYAGCHRSHRVWVAANVSSHTRSRAVTLPLRGRTDRYCERGGRASDLPSGMRPESSGDQEFSSLSALVLLHAVTRDRQDFAGFPARVAADHIIALDLPGHGDAAPLARYEIEGMAEALLGDIPSGAVLYGHSLGGTVALAACAAAPGRAAALVMEDPPLFEISPERMDAGPFKRGFAMLSQQKRNPSGPKSLQDWSAIVSRWPGARAGRTLADDGLDAVRRRARQLAVFDPRVLDALLDGSVAGSFDPIDALSQITCPVAILAGERRCGAALTARDCARLQELPAVALHHFPQVGHYPREAEPDRCAALTNEILRNAKDASVQKGWRA